jgi:hypothetical protein
MSCRSKAAKTRLPPIRGRPLRQLIRGWAGKLTVEATSVHLCGNRRITLMDADNAVVPSHRYACNRMERGALPDNRG